MPIKMWRTSGKLNNFTIFSPRRAVLFRQCRGVNANPRKVHPKTCQHFSNSAGGGNSGTGAGKLIVGAAVLTAGAVIGGVYYAKYDPGFRKTVEDKIPYCSALFNAVIGKNDSGKPVGDKTVLPDVPSSSFENRSVLPAYPSPVEKSPIEPSEVSPPPKPELSNPQIPPQDTTTVSSPSAAVSSVDQMAVSSVDLDISKAVEKGVSEAKKESLCAKEEAGKMAEDEDSVKKKSIQNDEKTPTNEPTEEASPAAQTNDIYKEDSAMNSALQTVMATVSELGRTAVECHERAVAAVRLHRDSLKEALEISEKDEVSKEQWEALNTLAETKTRALEEAKKAADKFNDMMEKIQANITEAKEKGLEASAEIASETLAKLTYALQQVKNTLKETEAEGTILKQFHDMIEQGREQLRRELAAIGPEFQDKQLENKVDEALVAYAEKRIRVLQETLEEREKQEGRLIEEALQNQQIEQEKIADMRLKHELDKLSTELNDLMRQKEAETAELHENDLRQQLRRQAAAFGDHLNEVLKVQANELETKYQSETREQLLLARQEFDLKLRGTLARLNGVIAAVENRTEIERQNKEAQELWLASQSLSTAIVGLGDEHAQLYPIHNEVEKIRRVTHGNKAVGTVLDSLSEDALHRGVYPEESLRRRFPSVRKVCKKVAMVGEEGGGVWTYLISYLQSLLVLDVRAKPPTSVDPDDLDTYQLLNLAANALDKGDTEQAVRYMNQLRGEPRRVAMDWIREARLFLEARQVARFLMSFASARNIDAEQEK